MAVWKGSYLLLLAETFLVMLDQNIRDEYTFD